MTKPAKPAKPRKTGHAATLADVGREAGVSAMAVSAVLNGAKTSSRISDETRERIVSAAQRLRYRPNATARGLADRRMNTIGVATTLSLNELNQYFLEVFNGVIEGAAAAEQNTTVFALADWKEGARRIPTICDGRIDGLILLAPWLEADAAPLLPEHTPFVSVHANNELPGVVNLESDEEMGAFEMVRHMIGLGHRRILYVAGPLGSTGAMRRVEGYRRAHAAAGLKVLPGYIVNSDYAVESGRRVLDDWLLRHRGEALPQAVFGGSDAIAIGCMDLLAARGLRTPEDVSVVGFDDTLPARSVRLATVRQPLREMGQRAVQVLVGLVEAKHQGTVYQGAHNIVLPTEIVLGRSLSTPRAKRLVIS